MRTTADGRRVGWVDTAKGAAILMVVLWHAYLTIRIVGRFPPWLEILNHVLANVRMPLFFLASGLLMERLIERPWSQLVRKRVVPLAWVLILWTIIGSVINLSVQLYPWNDSPLSGVSQVLWLPQGILWFVYALLVFAILARIVASVAGWQRGPAAMGMWLALVAYHLWLEEFHTREMVQYFPFFIAGVLGARQIKQATASWQALALIAAASLVGLAAISLAGVDGFPAKAGHNVCGTGLFVVAAAAIQPWQGLTRWLDAAGRNSLALFLGHLPIIAALFAVLPLNRADPVIAWLAISTLTVVGSLLMERGAQSLGLGWIYRVPEPVMRWLAFLPRGRLLPRS